MSKIDKYAENLKLSKKENPKYKIYDDFIKSIPAELYADKYGTIDEKIESLTTKNDKKKKRGDLIALSLCFLLKGDTSKAVDLLIEAEKISRG